MKTEIMKTIRMAMVIAVCLITTVALAQPQGPPPEEKIEALRIAFISQRLNLTPDEAQRFWPVYNSFRADLKTLRKNFGLGPGKPEPTADQALDFEQKKLDLKKKYKGQFEGALGKDKVNTLYRLEDEFKQKLREMRDQRQQNKGQQRPPAGGSRPMGGR